MKRLLGIFIFLSALLSADMSFAKDNERHVLLIGVRAYVAFKVVCNFPSQITDMLSSKTQGEWDEKSGKYEREHNHLGEPMCFSASGTVTPLELMGQQKILGGLSAIRFLTAGKRIFYGIVAADVHNNIKIVSGDGQ